MVLTDVKTVRRSKAQATVDDIDPALSRLRNIPNSHSRDATLAALQSEEEEFP